MRNNLGVFHLTCMCRKVRYSRGKSRAYPNCLEGRRLLVHFSISLILMSNLGEMTPTLFNRPVRFTTIFPPLWSSTTSNSPMYPCFIITVRNRMTTLEDGRNSTCRFPRFSALFIDFKAFAKLSINTMMTANQEKQINLHINHLFQLTEDLFLAGIIFWELNTRIKEIFLNSKR